MGHGLKTESLMALRKASENLTRCGSFTAGYVVNVSKENMGWGRFCISAS